MTSSSTAAIISKLSPHWRSDTVSPTAPVPASVVVIMHNSASTIIPCLEGLASQRYPIAEIIVVDDASTDDSLRLVEQFAGTAAVPVRLLPQRVNAGIGASFNAGVAAASSALLILVHSDSALPTPDEIERLTEPLLRDEHVVGARPILTMPVALWNRFPFWQQYFFARVVNRERHAMCAMCDAVRREAYLRMGGFDAQCFTSRSSYVGEDCDFHRRLLRQGRVVDASAKVLHVHDLSGGYGFLNMFRTRRRLARTMGKLVRLWGFGSLQDVAVFSVRPFLAVLPWVPRCHLAGLVLLLAFGLVRSRGMYRARATLLNPRILLVPVLDIFFVYSEAWWSIEGLLTPPDRAPASV